MAPLEQGSREERTFDAIVVGSGIAGGWAAKELSEKGLKTLVLERGRQVKHVEGYPTFSKNPWEFRYAGGRTPQDEVDKIGVLRRKEISSTCDGAIAAIET